jgi:hypothetical protein
MGKNHVHSSFTRTMKVVVVTAAALFALVAGSVGAFLNGPASSAPRRQAGSPWATAPVQLASTSSSSSSSSPSIAATTTAGSSADSAIGGTTGIQSYKGDLNVEECLAGSDFPIRPAQLIDLCKSVVIEKGIGTKDGGDCLAEDFVFRAQFVEVDKRGLLAALDSFNLEDSFDVKQQCFGWTVDPLQPNRVWFLNRQEATQVKAFAGIEPKDNKRGTHLVLPPQNLHVDFNADGKVTEFGFYTVDRAQGNTGGLGGAYGYFYGVGRPLPFPEGKPYAMSFRRRAVEFVASLATKLLKRKKEQKT